MFYKLLRYITIHIVYPVFEIITNIVPLGREKFERLFIKLNNYCVNKYKILVKQNLLILLPHCIQYDDCTYRITKDISNCKKCGKCVIKKFVELQNEIGVPIKIATGGTIARRLVKEILPDFIIACACERDLASGIYDSYPFLVLGILNERPNGPCINTTIDFDNIQNIIKKFHPSC